MIRLVAYQNLYGPITPERLDLVAARLGMDVVAPHMRRGKKTKLSDHLMTWGEKKKSQTPEEMLAAAREITAAFKQQEKAAQRRKQAAQQRREKQRAARPKQAPTGGSGTRGAHAPRRRRPRPERR